MAVTIHQIETEDELAAWIENADSAEYVALAEGSPWLLFADETGEWHATRAPYEDDILEDGTYPPGVTVHDKLEPLTQAELSLIRSEVQQLDNTWDEDNPDRPLVTEHPALTWLAQVASRVPALLHTIEVLQHELEHTQTQLHAATSSSTPSPTVHPDVFELIETRAGLALANTTWNEGAGAMLKAVNDYTSGPFTAPVNPYSAPHLAQIAEEKDH